jgi:hypothetical protein
MMGGAGMLGLDVTPSPIPPPAMDPLQPQVPQAGVHHSARILARVGGGDSGPPDGDPNSDRDNTAPPQRPPWRPPSPPPPPSPSPPPPQRDEGPRRPHKWWQPYVDGHASREVYLGAMDLECPVCGALHFKDERASGTNLRNPEFSLCCNRGKVELPYLRDPPTLLQRLLGSYKDLPEHRQFPVTRAQETQGVAFRDEIRKYNSAMAFASLGVKIDGNVTGAAGGPYSFRINGQLHHKIGALLPEVSIKLWLCYLAEGMNIQDGQPPQYAQIYIHDGDHATIRCNRNPNTEREIFSDLEAMLMEHNPFIHDFKTAHERLLNTPADQQEVRC